ncbi:hypothetical protein LEN26_008038 [Aphanomyces euteiches]|nr:hypothetical protein AeMF1_001622 [Aphanomyces euteiches]KAH9130962.1 hypothetical protein LEN26_008038 [Aphanomyces euteiches]KAH9192967.1 hypothetical protein AeNC1_005059 [Aphanomyces euteiches]
MVSEAYIRDAVHHRLIPLPVDMEVLDEAHLEKPLDVDHLSLSNLKKTLDTFSSRHGFVVKQIYRTTGNAKWSCRSKSKANVVEDDLDDVSTCSFTVNANVRKNGGVYISSMNLNHNHPLASDASLPHDHDELDESPTMEKMETVARGTKRPISSESASDQDDNNSNSWTRNLVRNHQPSSGFWGNARWYDLQLTIRLPLVPTMLDEMVLAMPPVGEHDRVADVCAGSGACSEKVLKAYPEAEMVLFDGSKERLDMATRRLSGGSGSSRLTYFVADLNGVSILRKAPFNVIVASLAVHVLVEQPAHYASSNETGTPRRSVEIDYKRVFQMLYSSLQPNGHIIVGDHVGIASLFSQLKWMEEIGFVDVDCSWRQRDFFVLGGRRPGLRLV